MTDVCPKCGRPKWAPEPNGWNPSQEDACVREDTRLCRVAAEAYQRGLRDGVEMAKRHVSASATPQQGGYFVRVHWSGVEDELTRRLV